MSWSHSFIPRRKSRQLVIAIIAATLLLTWRWIADGLTAPSAKYVLITTPSNTTYPFHRLSTRDLTATPLQAAFDGPSFPTHILAHPLVHDVYLVTNEVDRGSILAVQLDVDAVHVVGQVESGGAQPAYCALVHGCLICANYGSPVISLHTFRPDPPFISFESAFSVPVTPGLDSHPHQIIPSTVDDSLFYVPDLGQNCVLVIQTDGKEMKAVQKWIAPADLGSGARHAVVTPDGKHLILAFQSSSTVTSIPLHPGGVLLNPSEPSLSTLPSLFRYSSSSFALSDVHLIGSTLYVLNRLVMPPYGGEGDTIAMFALSDGALSEQGHIQLPCYQPREIVQLSSGRMGVTCVGGDSKGTGLVVIKDGKVEAIWPGASSWGLVSLA